MKKIYLVFIFLSALGFSCRGMNTASLNLQVTINNITQNVQGYIASQKLSYTAGGLTFTYPTGLFTMIPMIRLAVQANAAHADNITYTAEISANSSTSATVMVYKFTTTLGLVSIAEAASGDVTIHFVAAGM